MIDRPATATSPSAAACPDLMVSGDLASKRSLERRAEVAPYRALFDAARTSALSPVESRTLIHRRAKEYGS